MSLYDGSYKPLPSLADIKAERLSLQVQAKELRLNPEAVSQDLERRLAIATGQSPDGGGLDYRQGLASLANSAGVASDWLGRASNATLGSRFDTSAEHGWSNQDNADESAGFYGREAYNQKLGQLSNSWGQAESVGDYLGAVGQGLALGPQAALDSLGTIGELAAGGVVTKGIGLAAKGAVALSNLNKGKKLANVIDDVPLPVKGGLPAAIPQKSGIGQFVNGAEQVTASSIKQAMPALQNLSGAIKNAGMKVGQTSIMTANIMERMRTEYINEHGKPPSGSWYAANLVPAVMLNVLELGIISKALPKFPPKIIGELKDAVTKMDDSYLGKVFNTISDGASKVISVAGAEAGQEYLQTWHEILAAKISPEESGNLVNAISKQLANKENRTEAAVGALLGAGAGGTVKAVSTAPATAGKVAINSGTAAVSAGRDYVAGKNSQAQLDMLSDDELGSIMSEHSNLKSALDVKKREVSEVKKGISEAKTRKDLYSIPGGRKAVSEVIQKSNGTADPNSQETLDSAKNILNSNLDSDVKTLEKTFNSTATKKVVETYEKQSERNAKKGKTTRTEVDPFPEVDQEAAATAAGSAYGANSSNAIRGMKNSQAVALTADTLNTDKPNTKNIVKHAQRLPVAEIQKVAAAIQKKAPRAAVALETLAQRKRNTLSNLGYFKDDVNSSSGVLETVRKVAKKGAVDAKDSKAVGTALKGIGKIKDLSISAVGAVEKALDVYEETSQTNLSKAEVKTLKDNIKSAKARSSKIIEAALLKLKKGGIEKLGKDSKLQSHLKKLFSDVDVNTTFKEIENRAKSMNIELTAQELEAAVEVIKEGYNSKTVTAAKKGVKAAISVASSKDTPNRVVKGAKTTIKTAAKAVKATDAAGHKAINSDLVKSLVSYAKNTFTKENYNKFKEAIAEFADSVTATVEELIDGNTDVLPEHVQTTVDNFVKALNVSTQVPGATVEDLNSFKAIADKLIADKGYSEDTENLIQSEWDTAFDNVVSEFRKNNVQETDKDSENSSAEETDEAVDDTIDMQDKTDLIDAEKLKSTEQIKASYKKLYSHC